MPLVVSESPCNFNKLEKNLHSLSLAHDIYGIVEEELSFLGHLFAPFNSNYTLKNRRLWEIVGK